ncbi:MAG: phosphodiester glycosidase family protein [Lachnospiraceae bacterium]|nr:phosphodiester glycosidase family protein [Lachnospiraceae bacterium]
MKSHIWAIGFTIVLLAFTTYITLDTFVLSSVYMENATEVNTSMFDDLSGNKESENTAEKTTENTAEKTTEKTAGSNAETENETESKSEVESKSGADDIYIDANTYIDENITIKLTDTEQYGTSIHIADITVSSAEYLKAAFAKNSYGKNVTATTSSIAASNNAILAINGDYYGARERGYVIRNGVVYRSTASGSDIVCIYADGTMEIVSDSDYTADELVDRGVWQALSFGPALIKDGAITVDEDDEVRRAMVSNPRTAIGMIDDNHYIFLVADGRTSESDGLSLSELAQIMQSLGCSVAYNLDGGGSSTMYFNGKVVNNPTTNGRIKERAVSDIVYIGA